MKVKCPITGIIYTVDSPNLGKSIAPHPILSQYLYCSDLVSQYLEPWAAGELSPTETHLLGVAFLMKLPLEGTPLLPDLTPAEYLPFWNKYLERLAKLATRLEDKSFDLLPKIRVTPENFAHLPHWIDDLHTEVSILFSPISERAKKLNRGSYKTAILDSDNAPLNRGAYSQQDIEQIILRGMKGSILTPKESKIFPQLVAEWAESVGEFPTSYVTLESGKKLQINELWKDIIIAAFSKDSLNAILQGEATLADADELLEWCYTEIPPGSTQASILFKKLEVVVEVLEEFRATPKPAKFQGTQDELLALIADPSLSERRSPSGERVTSPSKSPDIFNQDDGLTFSQRLAIKVAQAKAASKSIKSE